MMKNMKIFTKLIMAFSIVVVMALILGIISVVILTVVSNAGTEIYQQHLVGITYISSVMQAFEETRISTLKAALAGAMGDKKMLDDAKSQVQANIDLTNNYFAEFAQMENSNEIKNILPEILLYRDIYLDKLTEFINACDNLLAGEMNGFNQTMTEQTASTLAIKEKLKDVMTMKEELAKNADESGRRLTQISRAIQIIILACLIIFSVTITLVISLGIKKDLGDLIEKLMASASTISVSVNQLSDASDNLAQGSSEQAASIEETSATMNETTSIIKQNSERVQLVSSLAAAHIDSAVNGITKAEKMVDFMEKLSKASDEINKIVSTINSIASQTTILSLNAAVEAVRAGESGKSFTVVAEEVRNLAQKSTAAAASTANIIKENIELAKQGVESSKEMAEAWHEVKDGAEKAAAFLMEISTVSQEQTQGVHQVNIAIAQMEQVTQQNAALAEENAATSSNIKNEIVNLEEAVEIAKKLIKIDDSEIMS